MRTIQLEKFPTLDSLNPPTKEPQPKLVGALKRAIIQRRERGLDTIIFIIGGEGLGKTSVMMALASYFDEGVTIESWKDHYSMANPNKFAQGLSDERGAGSVDMYDEVEQNTGKESFNDRLSIALKKIFSIRRFKQRTIMLAMPDLPEILKGIRHKAHFVVEVRNRDDRRNEYSCWLSRVMKDHYTGAHGRYPFKCKTHRGVIFIDGPFGLKVPVLPIRRKYAKMIVRGVSKEWREDIKAFGDLSKEQLMTKGASAAQVASDEADYESRAIKKILAAPARFIRVVNKTPMWNERAIAASTKELTEKGIKRVVGHIELNYPALLFTPPEQPAPVDEATKSKEVPSHE